MNNYFPRNLFSSFFFLLLSFFMKFVFCAHRPLAGWMSVSSLINGRASGWQLEPEVKRARSCRCSLLVYICCQCICKREFFEYCLGNQTGNPPTTMYSIQLSANQEKSCCRERRALTSAVWLFALLQQISKMFSLFCNLFILIK